MRAILLLVLPASLLAQAQPVPVTNAKPGWQWTMDSVNKVVNAVRAGRSLQPKTWPNGARVAVLLSFDVDNETVAIRFGEPTVGSLSQAEYGARAGLPRVVSLLDAHKIPATFFIPSVSLAITPSMAGVIKKSGRHEFGIHGWIHELNSVLPYDAERDLMMRSADTLAKITGVRPVGLRTPSWDFSPHTLAIEKEMGLLYDTSLMADEDCYELLLDGAPTGVIELPVEWIRDDAPYFMMNRMGAQRPYTPPADVLDIFRRELDAAHAEGGIFQVTMHPHIIGYRSRIWIVEELIRHARALPGVWFATHAEVAAFAKAHAA